MIPTITGSNVGWPLIKNGQTGSPAAQYEITVRIRHRRMPEMGEATVGLDTGNESTSGVPSMQWRYSAQAYLELAVVASVSILPIKNYWRKFKIRQVA
jgi:hypothetical protein